MLSKNKWILANRNLLVAVSLSILTIASCGGGGGSGSSSPNEKPVSVSLTATPSIVGPGETTTLNWVSTNAQSCELTNQAGVKVASGLSDAYTTTLPLDSAAAFTITCIGITAGDTVSQTKTFAKVSAKPTVTLNASPSLVASGATSNISWSSSNSVSCQFTEGSVYGAPPNTSILATSGSFNTAVLTGPATRTFTIQCDGPGGSTIQSTPVTVGPPAPVISSFIATPSSIISGAGTILSWASSNSTSCSLLGIVGPVATTDTLSDSPPTTTTYTLTCTGAGGSASASTTVSVAPVTTPPTVTLTPASTSITSGTTTTITWRADTGSSCTFTSGAGAPSGAITTDGNNVTFTTPALTSTTTYSVSCTKTGLTSSQSATINIVSGTCSTAGATDAISLPGVVASRTIGVAPLSVFFDATGATASATTRPFHDLEYRWNFGDPLGSPVSGTTWATGSKPGVSSRNSATGPVAAHVYERPGTYTIALAVTDGANSVTNNCTQITVQDPDVIFAGASLTGPNTICVGSTSTPTPGANGCPADALGVQQANFQTAISNYAKTGKRVLFKRGDTFTSTSQAGLGYSGPGIIGAFGSGQKPVVNFNSSALYHAVLRAYQPDWRFLDLDLIELSGTGKDHTGISLFTNSAVLRTSISSFRVGLQGTSGNDGIAVQDSTINPGGDALTGYYCPSCNHTLLLGNTMYMGDYINPGHSLRFQGGNYFVLQNSNQLGTLTKGTGGASNAFTIRGNAQYGLISDNFVHGYDGNISPQNTTSNENQRDIIVENNFFKAAILGIAANNITIRNNIFNITNQTTGSSDKAISISYGNTAGAPMPTAINIYNNSVFNSNAVVGAYVLIQQYLSLNASCEVQVKNNLVYAINGANPYLIGGTGNCTVTGSSGTYGNSSNLQISTPPLWLNGSTNYSLATDFQLNIGSYAIGNGVSVPVYSDFFGNPKTSPYDSGAITH